MTPLPHTPEVLEVARRVVWFKEPEEALAAPYHFMAHVMTYGMIADIKALSPYLTKADYAEALAAAPPGIFDPRSWAFWHLWCGTSPAPPLPQRTFGEESGARGG